MGERGQEFAALMLEKQGAFEIPEREKVDLAWRIRRRIERPETVTPGRKTETLGLEEDE